MEEGVNRQEGTADRPARSSRYCARGRWRAASFEAEVPSASGGG